VLDKVDVNKDIMLDLGANSLDYFAIASSIYDEFEVQIVDEDSGVTLKSALDIANFIKEQL
jgi:acyl carrier protein